MEKFMCVWFISLSPVGVPFSQGLTDNSTGSVLFSGWACGKQQDDIAHGMLSLSFVINHDIQSSLVLIRCLLAT